MEKKSDPVCKICEKKLLKKRYKCANCKSPICKKCYKIGEHTYELCGKCMLPDEFKENEENKITERDLIESQKATWERLKIILDEYDKKKLEKKDSPIAIEPKEKFLMSILEDKINSK